MSKPNQVMLLLVVTGYLACVYVLTAAALAKPP
jgi:hypothetical protein